MKLTDIKNSADYIPFYLEQYKITRKDYERLRQKLDKEHHWMSGMVRESTGRARFTR